ncbi:hypothetical protein L211DRAFT_578893 [Terfezia boudieri ATCC MYA-4762]|uniref:Uncharacterized protein n=1 Tax=Terfezia boudieri ATCC MYA-4762 TaxID=1051890 RepID=A0A3N4LAY3_9PEZI|nr:hypothetical protein L211DRAFT_578893 [Terfezia boudieri ATCC MYA-4762]
MSLVHTGPASRTYAFHRCRSLLPATSTSTLTSSNKTIMSESNRQTETASNPVATTEIPPRIRNHINTSDQTLPLRHPRTLSPPEEGEIWTRNDKAHELQHNSPPLPRTPLRGNAPLLITPPTSVQGLHNYCGAAAHSPVPSIPRQQPAPSNEQLNPVSLFLNPPSTIYELTPTLLSSLSHALTYSPEFHHAHRLRHHYICIAVTPLEFDTLMTHYKWLLSKEYYALWEYSGSSSTFIIKCMPTPIHESIANVAVIAVYEALRTHTGVSALSTGVKVCANSEIAVRGVGEDPSRRIPDISLQVRLHPNMPERYFTGIVWEIGFAQTLKSLQDRARMWFTQGGCTGRTHATVKVHMVVVVHVSEHDLPEMYYDEDGNQLMSRTKAVNTKLKWPSGWFKGGGILEEVRQRRSRGKTLSQIKQELKEEIEAKLLLEDDEGRGRLVPLLMEPLQADLFVYRKKPEADLGVVDTNEKPFDMDCGIHPDDDSNADETRVQDSEFEAADQEAGDLEDTSNDQSSILPSESESNDDQEAGDLEDTSAEADLEAGLHRVYSISLIRNSLIPPSLGSDAFEIILAELYGSVGTNAHDFPDELTNRMPPAMRPHAHKTIAFPAKELAEACLLHGGEMRERRATDRARGIVRQAWTEVERELVNRRKEAARVKATVERGTRRKQRRKLHEVGDDEEVENEDNDETHGAEDGTKIIGVKRVKRGAGVNETSRFLSK